MNEIVNGDIDPIIVPVYVVNDCVHMSEDAAIKNSDGKGIVRKVCAVLRKDEKIIDGAYVGDMIIFSCEDMARNELVEEMEW